MKIFDPILINQTQIRNRLVVSAMVTAYCGEDGLATEKFIAYHERKARGGFGLIITEDYAVTPTAGGSRKLPGLWDDAQIPSHQELTRRVHAAGARIFCQIYHAGREAWSAVVGHPIIAPSALADPLVRETPHEMTVPEIHELVERFGDAALRAKKAGFDGVEIHGAHGYLVGQFLSPFSNKRCDEYGGTILNRCRFMTEIIQNIRSKCGNEFAIQMRMSAVEFVPGGLGIEESKTIAMIAEQAGLNSIHVSQGVYGSMYTIIPPFAVDHGAFINNAAEIKKVVSIPVIGVGRINDPWLAESIIASGKADLCTMARASLADPDMPNKAAAGKFDEIIHCIGCVQGCAAANSTGGIVRCLVNPMTGMEDEYVMKPAVPAKHVVVVGGGVAGCEAAIIAAQRGHRVTLLEKSQELGGQFIAASIPVGKGEFSSFIGWQKLMLNKLKVQVVLGVEATKEVLAQYHPDAVIIAAGSTASVPPIPGLKEHGVLAEDILRGRAGFGNRVVVVGGGQVGAETADHMAAHGAQSVTILEMMPNILADGDPLTSHYLLERFAKAGVQVVTSAKLTSVEGNVVAYQKDGADFRIEEVDTVVIATGRRSDTALQSALEKESYDIVVVGDARKAKSGYLDIQEGFEAGLYI